MEKQASCPKPHPYRTGGLVSLVIFVTLSGWGSSAWCALAQANAATMTSTQVTDKLIPPNTPKAVTVAQKPASKPAWQDLTPAQQQSLKPLAGPWGRLSEAQKRKWLAVSKNYPSLPATEQTKLHSRMTEWVSLSPQQRAQARLNFAETKKLSPTQKAATWQAYQALSPEEKQKLAAKAAPKPVGTAAAVKPVPPQKLAVVPVSRQTSRQAPKLATVTHAVDRNTLLPHPPPLTDSALVQKN